MFSVISGPKPARRAGSTEPGEDPQGKSGIWRLFIAVAIIAAIVIALNIASASRKPVDPAVAPPPSPNSHPVEGEIRT